MDLQYEYELADKALATLGPDPAQKLADMGIKGIPGDPQHCVIAVYLNEVIPLMGTDKLTGEVRGWSVYTGNTVPINSHVINDGDGPSYGKFVHEFDTGGHPRLVDTTQPPLPPRQ